MRQLLEWVAKPVELDGIQEFNLILRFGRKPRTVATVWSNGTWHTWDRQGCGGWNSVEHNAAPLYHVKEIAAGAAILQGFI